MSGSRAKHPIAGKRALYEMPGTDAVTVRRELPFASADGTALLMDVYDPPARPAAGRTPAVVIVSGYPDEGFERQLGCRFKDTGATSSWGRLIAASGMVAITCTNREPGNDLAALLEQVRRDAASLGVAEDRVALWASSGNVPLALSVLMRSDAPPLACAVLAYGYTLDLDGRHDVADASRRFGFVNPCAGRSIADVRQDVPLLVVRAGKDEMPGLNASLDAFVAGAVAANLPLTFVNHADGPHAFDLFDDSTGSRRVIGQMLAFVRSCTGADTSR